MTLATRNDMLEGRYLLGVSFKNKYAKVRYLLTLFFWLLNACLVATAT